MRVRAYTVGVYVDVFNLTDRVVATRYDEVSGSAFGAIRNFSQPRRFRAGLRLTF